MLGFIVYNLLVLIVVAPSSTSSISISSMLSTDYYLLINLILKFIGDSLISS